MKTLQQKSTIKNVILTLTLSLVGKVRKKEERREGGEKKPATFMTLCPVPPAFAIESVMLGTVHKHL